VGQNANETLKVQLTQAEAAVASLSTRVAEYSARYERLRSSAAMVPQLEAEFAQLNRDYDINKKHYETLVGRRDAAQMSGDMQSVAGVSDFRLVDPPRVSPRPVSPNYRILFPLALVVSLGAGIAAMYVAREAKPSFFDGRSLREATGVPLLGIVSRVSTAAELQLKRRGVLRYAALTGALVLLYAGGLVAVEMLSVHIV
jgi:chromosome segregation ATPase